MAAPSAGPGGAPVATWIAQRTVIFAALALGLIVAAWACEASHVVSHWAPVSLAALGALLAGTTYAVQVRPQPGRLRLYGRDKVMVRSLDEWTIYQYGCAFDAATPEQQSEAVGHYRVGLRLFPARPQDLTGKRRWQLATLSFVTFCAMVTLSEVVPGWYRLALFAVFYGWIWACTRMSKAFAATTTTEGLSGLGL